MSFKLRPYQQAAATKGIEFLNGKSKNNSVIIIPTGGGKSLVIADIARHLEGNIIIFQPSKELLEQNYAKYISYGNEASIFSASKGIKQIGKVTYATIGSVVKHANLFAGFSHCIVDECHLVNPNGDSMYQKFFAATGLNSLGLTATPIRLKNYSAYDTGAKYSQLNMLNRQRPKSYHSFVHVTQINELAADGYFAPVNYRVNKAYNKASLKTNTTGAEYTEESVMRSLRENDVNGMITHFIRKTDRKHVLVFVKSIIDAETVCSNANKGKPLCEVISSKTHKKERERVLAQFKQGIIKAVINVGVLTTGFDFPALDCVVLGRPTLSLALYYQMIGRGVRPFPSKDCCTVLDVVNNYEKFGKVEDLIIEDRNGWGIFSNGRLLTGVPMYN
jgi:DNA repair protein RadD